jgi:Protein of unknown function (DUF1761)
MYFRGVNLWSVLVAAVSTMVIGFLWYSPLLFARPWMALMGYDPDKSKLDEMRKGAGKNYAIAFIASLISALVLGKLIELRPRSPLHGTWIAFAVWLGFVSTVQLTDALFSKKPFKLYAINTGYQLVCYLVMGTILAAWAS